MFQVQSKKGLYAIGLLAMLAGSVNVYAGRFDIPPRENLYTAKQHIQTLSYHVQGLISRSSGQVSGGQDEPCSRDRRFRGGNYIHEGEDDVVENDNLANIALQVMGREIFELGQIVDQANASYGTPDVYMYLNRACHKAGKLLGANQGAKVSAAIPITGYVQPSDFDANDFELQAVRQQLWCH